ncbi:hypothetical protein L226DRAFT_367294 [Lentinus tigrinus ALCF2SS1-7]|uniref:uncharacterized protein n=1 Tax=Lentinus tigrinus ALCF2SS1-7 TaxID=1328758 RepID=UPI001165DCAF|nr:hypothetical protein L226DRAFT_367294 [Lentinus tigrinus ALCF2SS1-7]
MTSTSTRPSVASSRLLSPLNAMCVSLRVNADMRVSPCQCRLLERTLGTPRQKGERVRLGGVKKRRGVGDILPRRRREMHNTRRSSLALAVACGPGTTVRRSDFHASTSRWHGTTCQGLRRATAQGALVTPEGSVRNGRGSVPYDFSQTGRRRIRFLSGTEMETG